MGFLVMVHGHGFRADVCQDSVFAQPGYVTYIGLRQERRTALPEPYQPSCRDTWPRRLQYYLQNSTRYTREDCLKICHQEILRHMCKCESLSLPFSSREDSIKMPLCGEKRWECVQNVRAIMDLKAVERFCRCYRSCVDIDYYKEVSFSALPEDIHNNQTGPQKRLLAQVVVYFKTLTFENVASVPKYDLDRVHSSFCGINGMCLGVSCLMFFSMLDACVQALWSYCRTRHQRHRQLSAATSTSSSYQE
ncbi:acid-sensing ion channel 4-A-like [Amblyomma americanum]